MPLTIMRTMFLVGAACITLHTANTQSPPVASWGSGSVDAAALAAPLMELAGSVALEEAILDHQLKARLDAGGAALPDDAIEREERLLLDAVAAEAGADDQQAAALIQRLRGSRGLGPRRYTSLLWRNAALRALVGPGIAVTAEDLSAALEMEFGRRYRARVLVTRDLASAAEALAKLQAAREKGGPLEWVFAELAAGLSVDGSGPRGGLLPSASAADRGLPPEFRAALRSLAPGEVSDVLALSTGAGLVLVEGIAREASTPTDAQRRAVEARVRARLERLYMDRLARDILDRAGVSVHDESLRWSWEQRPR
jgi:hypothetical protein